MDFSSLTLNDLTDEVFAYASRTSENAYRLLEQMRRISVPGKCEKQILKFFSRMAMRSAMDNKLRSWADGDLRLEIQAKNKSKCEIRFMHCTEGACKLMKRITLLASCSAFLEAGLDFKSIQPFALVKHGDDQLIFEAKIEIRRNTKPPPSFAKAEQTTEEWKYLLQPRIPKNLIPHDLSLEDWPVTETPTQPSLHGIPGEADQSDTVPSVKVTTTTDDELDASDLDDDW